MDQYTFTSASAIKCMVAEKVCVGLTQNKLQCACVFMCVCDPVQQCGSLLDHCFNRFWTAVELPSRGGGMR